MNRQVSQAIVSYTKETWDLLTKVRNQEASEEEMNQAFLYAEILDSLIHLYEERNYNGLFPSSIWLAKEVANLTHIIYRDYFLLTKN